MFSWISFCIFCIENKKELFYNSPSHTILTSTKTLLQSYFLIYLFVGVYMICHCLDVNCSSWAHMFEYLVPTLWKFEKVVGPLGHGTLMNRMGILFLSSPDPKQILCAVWPFKM